MIRDTGWRGAELLTHAIATLGKTRGTATSAPGSGGWDTPICSGCAKRRRGEGRDMPSKPEGDGRCGSCVFFRRGSRILDIATGQSVQFGHCQQGGPAGPVRTAQEGCEAHAQANGRTPQAP